MAIVKTVDFSDFVREFELYERQKNFSHNGLRVLFDYLEDLAGDADTGFAYNLDVIQLCCDYSEDTWEEIATAYSLDIDEDMDDDDKINAVREYLESETYIVDEDDGVFVYKEF